MSELTSDELKKNIQDLSTSYFPSKRLTAVKKLGQLPISNAEVVQALAIAVSLDSDVDVRSAAMQALSSPAHQAFLKDHPDFLRQATKSAIENEAREKTKADLEIMNEFLRRRTRERILYLILLGGMVGTFVLLVVGASQDWLRDWMVKTWLIIFVASTILVSYLSWRNWRCPACDSWLGGFTFTINAILSWNVIRCPGCGARLL